MNSKRILMCCLLAVTLTGCGGTTQPQGGNTPVSGAEQSDSYEELIAALQEANLKLEGKTENSRREEFAERAVLEDRIVDMAVQQLESDFNDQREATGVLPRPTIGTIEANITGQADVSEAKWARVKERVKLEKKRTDEYVDFESDKLGQNIGNIEKLNLLDNLYRLSGNKGWQESKETFVDGLLASIRNARAEGRYTPQAQALVAVVGYARSDDEKLADELASFDARAYESSFLSALGEGDLDQAYEVFTTMADAANFDRVSSKLEGTSQTMAEYFLAKADEAVYDGSQLARSVRLYAQADDMFDRLGLEAIPAKRFKSMIEQLTKNFHARVDGQDYEAALAYLLMIGDFDETNSVYQTQVSAIKASIQQAAVRKIAPTEFVGADQAKDYSEVIAPFIAQYLFEHLPNDVRFIERQQLETIMRERQRKRQTGLPSPVDYLISGTVLKAKVDFTKREGRKLTRVVVGHESTPNPAYLTWLQLEAKEREKIPAPAETIDVEKTENISLGVTEHHKAGVFSLSYRLLDATSQKVLLPDSVTKQTELKDTSTEGVEIGEFVQPFRLARLPSDADILNGLAKEAALEIGAKLEESLANQEEQYLARAQQMASADSCDGQARALGRAAAIQEMKGLEFAETIEALKQTVIDCY